MTSSAAESTMTGPCLNGGCGPSPAMSGKKRLNHYALRPSGGLYMFLLYSVQAVTVRALNLVIISSTTRVRPSISSSGVIPAKFMLQLTYAGRFVFRAKILDTRVAYSILEPLSHNGVLITCFEF